MHTPDAQPDYITQNSPPEPSDIIQWGLRQLEEGRFETAEQTFRLAIQQCPNSATAYNNLGVSLLRAGNWMEASHAFAQAVTLQPDHAEAINNLSIIQLEHGNPNRAADGFKLAIHYRHDYPEAWNNLGNALAKLDEPAQAAECYHQSLTIKPAQTDPLTNLGTVLMESGKLAQGEQAFRLAIRSAPDNPVALATALTWLPYDANDPDFSRLPELYALRHQFPIEQHVLLGFAMGRVHDKAGEYEQAFTAWQDANQQQLRLRPFDVAKEERIFAHIQRTFSRELIATILQERPPLPESTLRRRPIFIVGMMRSGSTLLEQMLAAHSRIAVAGEVPWLQQAVETLQAASPEADASLLDQIGNTYLDQLWQKHPDAPMVIDKQLGNYLHLGVIRILFPHAIVLHMQRNALDCCLSCYSLRFSSGHEYTFDQSALGGQYQRYRQLMRHWQQTLPEHSVLDIRYETLVREPEQQLKRVLAHMGLDWENACLQPEKVQRTVRTASLLQVRQPVYQHAIGRWRAYQPWLHPLIDALGEFANEAMQEQPSP